MTALLWLSAAAYSNIVTNSSLDTDLTGWTHDGCAIVSQCGDYMAYCESGESIYQSLAPGESGVYRVQWRRRSGGVSWYYGRLLDASGGSLESNWNDGSANCTNSSNHYVGLDSTDTYRLKFDHPSYAFYMDNAVVIKTRDWVTHTYDANNQLDNPGFYGNLDDWTTHAGAPHYEADEGNDDYGRLVLDDSEVVKQEITLSSGGTYTYGFSLYAGGTGWGIMAVYSDGASYDSITDGPCAAYCTEQGSVELSAGTYEIRLTGKSSGAAFDDVYFLAAGESYEDPPGSFSWTGIDLYYPYEQRDIWSHYQTYSATTWYGGAYDSWNVYQLRPGAWIYPVATLDIQDVGVGTFGYYIDARINAYHDVPSTTIRYEGLASVNVAAGQRINPNCPLGAVGPNSYLGEYHLLIYGEFDGSPINLAAYFNLYPDPDLCMVADPNADTLGPASGEVQTRLLEVCQACAVPISWTNLGRWIVWLECMIQNMFSCWLIEWINGVIDVQILTLQQLYIVGDNLQARINDLVGMQILSLGRLAAMGDWMVLPVNAGLDWLASAAQGIIDYLVAWYRDLGARVDNLGYIIMSYAGGSRITYVSEEAGTNYWDVLVAIFGFMGEMVSFFTSMISRLFDLIISLINLVVDLVSLFLMVISGFSSGLIGGGGNPDVDLVAGSTGVSAVSCTETGAFATSGASAEKVVCWFLIGLGFVNASFEAGPLSWLIPLFIAVLAIGLLFWVMSQFQEIMQT